MEVTIPDMNPIRFVRTDETPDWSTYFPNPENVLRQTNYIPGIQETDSWSDWIINKEISLQFRITVAGTEDISVYKYDASTDSYSLLTTITPTDITPTGWISETVKRYQYTPSSEGVYYFESSSAAIQSDKFVVWNEQVFKKRLVQIEFVNSINDYYMVFWDNGVSRYEGLAYFTGFLTVGLENTISASKSDRGDLVKLRSTPVPTAMLYLTDLHYTDVRKLNLIFSCDTLTINGITYQNAEIGEPERIEASDLVKMAIKLNQTNYEYVS